MLETDIKKLTTAVQELTAAIQGGATIAPATTAGVAQAVDNLAITQQGQMDAIQQQPVQQQPVQQQPVQQQPVQQQPVQQQPVQTTYPDPNALTQDIVVKHLTDAMARLGAEGQAKVVGALSANFGTHKVPEIQPAQWPQVIAVVQQLV